MSEDGVGTTGTDGCSEIKEGCGSGGEGGRVDGCGVVETAASFILQNFVS